MFATSNQGLPRCDVVCPAFFAAASDVFRSATKCKISAEGATRRDRLRLRWSFFFWNYLCSKRRAAWTSKIILITGKKVLTNNESNLSNDAEIHKKRLDIVSYVTLICIDICTHSHVQNNYTNFKQHRMTSIVKLLIDIVQAFQASNNSKLYLCKCEIRNLSLNIAKTVLHIHSWIRCIISRIWEVTTAFLRRLFLLSV